MMTATNTTTKPNAEALANMILRVQITKGTHDAAKRHAAEMQAMADKYGGCYVETARKAGNVALVCSQQEWLAMDEALTAAKQVAGY
ncbi:hypothetical protein HN937_28245 [Candidatus Poribacteria bacterium]|jgi:hypothetical protein|nr:hypothetical protein [Candidatus Poribacteria bacterium]